MILSFYVTEVPRRKNKLPFAVGSEGGTIKRLFFSCIAQKAGSQTAWMVNVSTESTVVR